jgi:hypothetical protein
VGLTKAFLSAAEISLEHVPATWPVLCL